jgi:uncharacterized membrane protein YfcA
MPSELPVDLLLFIVATFVGALVTGVAGFAFGLIASAIWLHAITPAQSAALIAAFAIVIQGSTLWKIRHAVKFSRLIPLLVGGALGVPLGAYVLRWASPSYMRAFIGIALVLFSLYSLVRPKLRPFQGGTVAEGIVGVVSGFLGGSTGLAGIPVIIWATLRGWSKDEQRAVFQPVAILIFAMTLAWLGSTGLVTTDTVWLFLWGIPALALGTWIGLKLYGKLDEATFRTVVLVLLLVSGLALLPSAIMGRG